MMHALSTIPTAAAFNAWQRISLNVNAPTEGRWKVWRSSVQELGFAFATQLRCKLGEGISSADLTSVEILKGLHIFTISV